MQDLMPEVSYETIDETVVRIKHKLQNFAKPISLKASEFRVQDFPEENLSLHLTIDGANCGYCLRRIEDQGSYNDYSPNCLCHSRSYDLQLKFENALHLMSTDYHYDISCRLSKRSRIETLFSSKCHRTDMTEVLNGQLMEPAVNIQDAENLQEVQVCLKIRRFKKGRELRKKSDLADLYERSLDFNQRIENVALNVAGRIFNVSKQILVGRSPVFKAMFSHEMSETKSNIVDVKDMEVDAIEIMLQYLHTNKTDNIHKKPIQVYKAAHYFGIEDLQDACVEWMKFNINAENFVSMMRLATRHSELTDLYKRIGRYVKYHGTKLVERDDYQRFLLDKLHKDTVTEILLICKNYPIVLKDVKMQAMRLLKENINEVVRKDEFLGLFGDNLTREIIQFLFADDRGGNGKRKRSKSE